MVMTGDSQSLNGLAVQTPRPSEFVYLGAGPNMQTKHLAVLLFVTQKSFANMVFGLLFKIKDIKPETSIYH